MLLLTLLINLSHLVLMVKLFNFQIHKVLGMDFMIVEIMENTTLVAAASQTPTCYAEFVAKQVTLL